MKCVICDKSKTRRKRLFCAKCEKKYKRALTKILVDGSVAISDMTYKLYKIAPPQWADKLLYSVVGTAIRKGKSAATLAAPT